MYKIIYLVLALCAAVANAQVDLTLRPGSSGEDVVEVVEERTWNLFGYDYEFLKRVSLVECRFGASCTTNGTGGIYKLREQWFKLTIPGNQAMVNHKATIQSLYNVTWNSQKYGDCDKPLISAFGTRLWMMVVAQAMPNTLDAQAAFWNTHMKSNESWTEEDFKRIVNEYEGAQIPIPCNAPMDMCLVIDGSGSIGDVNFEEVRNFSAALHNSYDPNRVRMALIEYSTVSRIHFMLNHTMSATEVQNKIKTLPYLGGGTNTNAGIIDAIRIFNDTPKREGLEGAPSVMVLFTDGQSNEGGQNGNGGVPNITNAYELGVESFAIGVGNYNLNELQLIAYNDSSRIFPLTTFDALRQYFGRINEETCEAPQVPQVGSVLNGTLVQNEKRFYRLTLPENGIRVFYDVIKGNFSAYAAYGSSTNKPSAVVYDFEITENEDGIWIPFKNTTRSRSLTGRANNETENYVYIGLRGTQASNEFNITTRSGGVFVQASVLMVVVMSMLSKWY